MTDVTGFGLAGHALEIAKGAKAHVVIDWSKVPLIGGVRELCTQGFITGASSRNWAGYSADVALPTSFAKEDQALLTDPQTSGGLLVSCNATAVHEVMAIFRRHGFEAVAEIGHIAAQHGGARLTVR